LASLDLDFLFAVAARGYLNLATPPMADISAGRLHADN